MSGIKRSERNSSIELLRIFAAIGVIVQHSAARALMYPAGTLNKAALVGAYMLFICAVNLFIMISGYFLSGEKKLSLRKVIEIIFQLQVIRIVVFIISLIIGTCEFNIEGLVVILIPADYFIMIYAALYLISPYINHVLNSLSDNGLKKLVLMLVFVFAAWNYAVEAVSILIGIEMNTSTTVSVYGAGYGRSFVNFALCYVVGAAVRRKVISFKYPAVAFAVCVLLNGAIYPFSATLATDYTSPLIIASAAAALMAAERFEFRSRIINFVAKTSLTIYIIHMTIVVQFDWERYVSLPLADMILRFAAVVVFILAVGIVADTVYRTLFEPAIRKLRPKLDSIEISV